MSSDSCQSSLNIIPSGPSLTSCQRAGVGHLGMVVNVGYTWASRSKSLLSGRLQVTTIDLRPQSRSPEGARQQKGAINVCMIECDPLLSNFMILALKEFTIQTHIRSRQVSTALYNSLLTPYITGRSDLAAHPSCAPSSPRYPPQSVHRTVL